MSSTDDLIHQQLHHSLQHHQGNGLWVMDENLFRFAPASVQPELSILSNRFDIYTEMKRRGWSTAFSDFDFTSWADQSLACIYYRLSKEKPVVHHVINQARRCLKHDGRLILLGAKNEGMKSYYDKSRSLFADAELIKLGKGAMVARLTAGATPSEQGLDDRDYPRLRPIGASEGAAFSSKPGVFGWDKEDAGSVLLADHLSVLYSKLANGSPRVLDLGCGYGYLSARAWQQGASDIVATDNNAAALLACRQNFSDRCIQGRVVADDCAAAIDQRFDLLLCNPPFHQGFSVEDSLTERFLATAARLLEPNGQAAFVVNRFIPLERKAQPLFADVECFVDNGSFKLVRLAAPRQGRA